MPSAVLALEVWRLFDYKDEPEGWNRAMTKDDEGNPIMFRRRPTCKKESEYIAS
jgi:hypothetical protein